MRHSYSKQNRNATEKILENYLLPGQTIEDMFFNVASKFCQDLNHRDRIFRKLCEGRFLSATPTLIYANKGIGCPISCFTNEYQDSIHGIMKTWDENITISTIGGGIGSNISNVRSIGEKINKQGSSSGIIPIIKVQDMHTYAINQCNTRKGASSVYLHISHPEIVEFINIRKPTGDINRRANHLYHGIVITDEFMHAVENDSEWHLKSPVDGHITSTVSARSLWIMILESRISTGVPYILFIDNVNASIHPEHKQVGLFVKTSNLCTEIMLPTGKDHLGNERMGVCCLASLNLLNFLDDEYEKTQLEEDIYDIALFLDGVLDIFCDIAPKELNDAVYSVRRERSIGIGVFGYHTFLQEKGIRFDSEEARLLNKKIFSLIDISARKASKRLALERGPALDLTEDRFANITAIAPTATISCIAGVSPGIEPLCSNAFVRKNMHGTYIEKNPVLEKLLEKKGINNDKVWSLITENDGSIQGMDKLFNKIEQEIFKTAFEIDQKSLIQQASDRQKYISQGQSLNLFIKPGTSKSEIHDIHFGAWKGNLKSLYYLRTQSVQRAGILQDVCESCS